MASKFKDEATQNIFDDVSSKGARAALPQELHRSARRKLLLINAAVALSDLRLPPGNQLEALSGNRQGQHSIRINDKYRICFTWSDEGATEIEIVDYH